MGIKMSTRRPPKSRVWMIEEVAEYLKVSKTTIYGQLKDHKIPAFKIGSEAYTGPGKLAKQKNISKPPGRERTPQPGSRR